MYSMISDRLIESIVMDCMPPSSCMATGIWTRMLDMVAKADGDYLQTKQNARIIAIMCLAREHCDSSGSNFPIRQWKEHGDRT